MKAILKQAAGLVAGIAAIYGLLLVISLVLFPMHRQSGGLDSSLAGATLFETEPKYVFLNRASLRDDKERLILLGASNVVTGFHVSELQPLLPDLEVDNLGISGANLTEMRQAYDLIRAAQSPSGPKHTTYAIGIWYGVFQPDGLKWNTPDRHGGETDLDIERYRYGFFRRSAAGPVQVLPTEDLELGLVLIHPYLTIDRLARDATDLFRAKFLKMKPEKTVAERNASVVTPEKQAQLFAYWHDQFQGATAVPPEQFAVLSNMVTRMLADGNRVVVVDLPLPSWHSQHSALNDSYKQLRDGWLQQMNGKQDFAYLDLQDAFPDDEFVDEVHPKPRTTAEWSKRLAAAVADEIAKAGASSAGLNNPTGATP